MRKRNRYARGEMGLSSVCVGAAWIALWLVWPSGGAGVSSARLPASFSVQYSTFPFEDKDLTTTLPFVDHISAEFMRRDENDEPENLLLSRRLRPPRYLERNTEMRIETDANNEGPYLIHLLSEPDAYRLRWTDERVFPPDTGKDMKVIIRPAGKLKTYGFQIPKLPIKKIKSKNMSWTVVVTVEMGDFGRPEHVFLESGCSDKSINTMIVRTMYRGTLTTPGGRCSGRVTVSACR